ncbi:MAG TPA: hypothetical protein VMS65_08950 [Polyangiaceae bacterium]|nr:hypothetical protein [Polyangiaceae bacterium]
MPEPRPVRHLVEILDERARTLRELTHVLAVVGAEHVLIGGLAVGYYGRPRATLDVDLLIPGKSLVDVREALEGKGYVVKPFPGMIRTYRPDDALASESIADIVAREANPVLREAARHSERATLLGISVNVIAKGALIALKFHAVQSPDRKLADRYQDIADIGHVIARGFDADDRRLAGTVAATIDGNAVARLEAMLDDLSHGRPVAL